MEDPWLDEGNWIYVFMTSENINRYKVGLTRNNPLFRVNQLKTGDPYLALQLAYFIPPSLNLDISSIEAAIHQQLESQINFHNGQKSEWFMGDARGAWIMIDQIFLLLGHPVTDHYQIGENKVVRFWGGDLEDYYNWEPLPLDEDGEPIF